LLVVPWTVFWERNFFLEGTLLGAFLSRHAVRGAMSGIGVICLVAALAELWDLRPGWFRRRALADSAPGADLPYGDVRDR
jgi:hypothetical protein